MRTLGKTGARVSILAFGSGSRFLAYKEEDKALAAMSSAIDAGVTYIDTAYGYGNGQSETWVGKLMPARRKEIFLATKVNARKGDEAMRIIEGSLKRLQTDQVDLLHIHSLLQDDDLKAIEAPDGVLNVVRKMRDQKVARFIGITSHTDPVVLKTALERHDFDCTQMALNAAKAGQAKGISGLGEKHPHSFESLALPVANRKKMGVIAMKVFAQEGLSGKAPVEKLIRYSMSLPVTAAVVGMPKVEYVQENIRVAKAFKPLPASEMKQLSEELSGAHKASLDAFFHNHVDA
jgi:predicted aldo/keto reductase-like oxidoreductase